MNLQHIIARRIEAEREALKVLLLIAGDVLGMAKRCRAADPDLADCLDAEAAVLMALAARQLRHGRRP